MNYEYLEDIHKKFDVSNEARRLFEKIIQASTIKKRDINLLVGQAGLSYALLALYRQQVNSGFVLADPLRRREKEEKTFFDPATGITFRLQWNPDRELRKNHALLIERGVIAKNVDETKLINRDKNGKACYLCKRNIDEQNPDQILLETSLAGEKFYIGANFAYITNNHFTVMNAKHRPQQYRKEIPKILNDFIDKTDGYFRAIFNGLAGASIKGHEHLQATTEEFPIEQIQISEEDVKYESDDIKISQPKYYIPVWVVEGKNKTKIEKAVDEVIKKWHSIRKQHSMSEWVSLIEQYNTENIITARQGSVYRTFIILRDKRRLTAPGKKTDMATFEAGGNIVLSYEGFNISGNINKSKKELDEGKISEELKAVFLEEKCSLSKQAKIEKRSDNEWKIEDHIIKKERDKLKIYEGTNERETFDKANLETVKQVLKKLSPEKQSCSLLTERVNFQDIRT